MAKRQREESVYSVNGSDASHRSTRLIGDRMYSIRIGDKLYQLSGASLESDAPSYFTNYFSDPSKTDEILFIDRSSKVFDKIYMHLQGYYIDADTVYEYAYLFSDAHYYQLPGLKALMSKGDIFTIIGNKSFRISRELIYSKGNCPNYFSISFDTLFQDPLGVRALQNALRPPPVEPPILSNRSPELFQDLLSALQGKHLDIISEEHRADLLRECRYYKFFALEQLLIAHKILKDPFNTESHEEIIVKLGHIKKSGLQAKLQPETDVVVRYSRPFVDKDIARNLIIQIDSPTEASLFINKNKGAIVLENSGNNMKKLDRLIEKFSNEAKELGKSDTLPLIFDATQCFCVINGREAKAGWIGEMLAPAHTTAAVMTGDIIELKVLKIQFRLFFFGDKPWLQGVSLDAVSDKLNYHKSIGFV